MTRFLAIIFALLATAAYAQYGTPTLQIDKSGSTRCLYVSDLNNTSAADKARAFGCLDSKGAWNLPTSLRNVKEITETDLRGYGYIGDGSSHPLSGITSLNGRSTVGWTLAQWQAVLPAAQALSDEIDGAVINSVISTTSGAIKFKLGPGTGRFSRPISSACGRSINFTGAGPELTKFQFGATDGWDHCITGTPQADKLELDGIALISTDTTSTTNIGVNARFSPFRNGYYNNFTISSFNSGMVLENSAGTTVNKGMIDGNAARLGLATAGVGIHLKGTNTFIIHYENTLVQYFATGYRFQSTSASNQLGIEDAMVVNSAAGNVQKCVQIDADYTGYSPLQYTVDRLSCDTFGMFIDAKQASQLSIVGGNYLIQPAVGSWTPAGQNGFNFCRTPTVRLEKAWISNNAVALSMRSYINITTNSCGIPSGQGASDVQVIGNKIEYANLTTTAAIIVKDTNAPGIVVRDNLFTNAFSVGQPPANAFSWSSVDRQSALFLGQPGETVSGSLTPVAMTTATPANVNTISLPPGEWTCSASIQLIPAGGATVTVFQGAWNTTSATMPTMPTGSAFLQTGSWTGGEVRTTGSWTIDLTAQTGNSNVYLVGAASFSGGTLQMNAWPTCVRLR